MHRTSRNFGRTSSNERRKADRTEWSSMLISGPIRANNVLTMMPGITNANEATALITHKMASATNKRP